MRKLKQFFTTYNVILILFVYLISISYLLTISTHNNFMLYLMGLFFLIFSFFKVIHLFKFKKSFARYDPFAKIFPIYGYIYPFIEIVLGALFIIGLYLEIISLITIVVLSSTTFGVLNQLRKGEIIECACLGVVFNLPLSKVTVFENVIMILMALWHIVPSMFIFIF